MTGNTAEAPSQMILQRASTAGKLHGIFTFMRSRAFPRLGLLFAVALSAAAAPALGWEHWGGDRGGQRFSPLAQITPANVGNLVRAFEFRTGDLEARAPAVMARTKFEATPLFVEDSLIFCSPFNEVIALDPGSGAQKWRYDPKISTTQRPGNRYVCRGVTYGSTIGRPRARPAGRAYSWAPTTSVSSRSTPGTAFPAPILASAAR